MTLMLKTFEELFKQGSSFTDLLPYYTWEDGNFIMADGSLGLAWEIEPVSADLKSIAELEQLAASFEGLFLRLPEKTACQLIMIIDRNIKSVLDGFSAISVLDSHEMVKNAMRWKLDLFTNPGSIMNSKGNKLFVKKIRCVLTIRIFPSWSKPDLIDRVKFYFGNQDIIRLRFGNEYNHACLEIKKIREIIESTLSASGATVKRLDVHELVSLLYGILNPARAMRIPSSGYNNKIPIREQILFNSPVIEGDGILFDGRKYIVISILDPPLQTYPGIFTQEIDYGGGRVSIPDILNDSIIVMNVHVPPQSAELSRIKQKKGLAFAQRFNLFGDTSIESTIIKEELDNSIKSIFSGGKKILHCRIHFLICGEKENISKIVEDTISILYCLGCNAMVEDTIAASLFLHSLPLCYDPATERYVKRALRIVSDNLSDILPLYLRFKGTGTPNQLYFNRSGELVTFDCFDSDTNPHMIVCGTSGSGKSFIIQDMIMQILRLNSYVFILDKGNSYRKLSHLCRGQYNVIDPDNPITINPLYGELTKDRLSFLVILLAEMASGGDGREKLNREEISILGEAISNAYVNNAGREIFLSDVIKELQKGEFNEEGIGKRLARKLGPFSGNGQYARFFDGPNQFNVKNKLTVFELGELETFRDLQSVILLTIMYFVTNFVSDDSSKHLRKYLIVDEAWSLLDNENTANFLSKAAKTYRKYGCAGIFITQQLADFATRAGQAIKANAPNKFLLMQEKEEINRMRNELDLTEKEVEVLKTVHTIKGVYSEALLKTTKGSCVIRMVADKKSYWMFTSDSSDNARLDNKIKDFNGDIIRAIESITGEESHV